jgi:hypothetical protein
MGTGVMITGRTCALLIVLALLAGCGRTVLSDEDLIKHFDDHESEFAELLEMLKIDAEVKQISLDSVRPDAAIDNRRWEAYKDILKRAGIRRVSTFWEEPPWLPEVVFDTSGSQYNTDFQTGYAFSRRAPTPLVDDLDAAMREMTPYGVTYRRIKGNWYIYLQSISD